MTLVVQRNSARPILNLIAAYCAAPETALHQTYRDRLQIALPFFKFDEMISRSRSLTFCRTVTELISGYCEENNGTDPIRYRLIANACTMIWSAIVSGERYVQTLFYQGKIEFDRLDNSEAVYEALAQIASTGLKREFLGELMDSLSNKDAILTFTSGPESCARYVPGFVKYMALSLFDYSFKSTKFSLPARAYIVLGPRAYTIYEEADGRWVYRIRTIQDTTEHEGLHHLFGHCAVPASLDQDPFWSNKKEEQVISGKDPNGGEEMRFSERAFAKAEGGLVRVSHWGVETVFKNPLHALTSAIINSVDGEASRLIRLSNLRSNGILAAVNALSPNEVNRLIADGNKRGYAAALHQLLLPFSKMFNVNELPAHAYEILFLLVQRSKMPRDEYWRDQVQLRQDRIRAELVQARALADSVEPERIRKRLLERRERELSNLGVIFEMISQIQKIDRIRDQILFQPERIKQPLRFLTENEFNMNEKNKKIEQIILKTQSIEENNPLFSKKKSLNLLEKRLSIHYSSSLIEEKIRPLFKNKQTDEQVNSQKNTDAAHTKTVVASKKLFENEQQFVHQSTNSQLSSHQQGRQISPVAHPKH